MKINFLPKLMQASLICCLTFTLTNCGNIDNPLDDGLGSRDDRGT